MKDNSYWGGVGGRGHRSVRRVVAEPHYRPTGIGDRSGRSARRAGTGSGRLVLAELWELRHAEAVSQAELAGRLEVTQSAISKLEHSEDVRVSTLRQYLEALGARLELVAVFDDEGRRVPIHLGKGDTA